MHDRVRALLMPCMHQEAMRGARAPRRHSIAKLLGRYMHNMSCLCMYPSIYPLILLYMVHYMCIPLCIYIYCFSCAGKRVCDELQLVTANRSPDAGCTRKGGCTRAAQLSGQKSIFSAYFHFDG